MGEKQVNIVLNASMDISKVKSAVAEISKSMDKVALPTANSNKLKSTITELEKEISNFEKLTREGIGKASDFTKIEKSGNSIITLFEHLQESAKALGNLGSKEISKLFPQDVIDRIKRANSALETFAKNTKSVEAEVKKYNSAITNAQKKVDEWQDKLNKLNSKNLLSNTDFKTLQTQIQANETEVNNLNDKLTETKAKADDLASSLKAPTKSSKYRALRDEVLKLESELANAKKVGEQLDAQMNSSISQSQYKTRFNEINEKIDEFTTKLNNAKQALNDYQNTDGKIPLDNLLQELSKIQGLDLSKCGTDIEKIKATIAGFENSHIDKIRQGFEQVQTATANSVNPLKDFRVELDKTRDSVIRFTEKSQELANLQSRVQYFFGITNTVLLFKRAVSSAIDTVKELDAAMAEMAVVTDKGIGDYWDKLPEYTRRANELGLAIKDVYESMTLFYQQGLNTEEAVALSNATLKMARIAGLDAAEATDRMTNALRGFNMALNETSANNVADVYSKLAAITASDVDEISTAMTKVASIANSAGMTFENTAAFLSQIIETTRESAETAGTALKTVIARFSEVKELYDQGLTSGEGEEGEIIDVNKVQTALRTVGISMTDFFQGQEGLDSIFIQLAEKWDTLDTLTQRYIATQAAGSRQQSRFIALMSDYARTQYLVAAANNAAGASIEQYEKTLESLQSKLNKLKNAWDQFTMGIANNKWVKVGVDGLTALINLINGVTGALGDTISAFSKIALSFATLKVGKNVLSSMFASIASVAANEGLRGGQVFIRSFTSGMKSDFSLIAKLFSKELWKGSAGIGMPTADISKANKAYQQLITTTNLYNTQMQQSFATEQIRIKLLNKKIAAEKAYKAELQALAAQEGLNEAQTATFNAVRALDLPLDAALMAAKAGLTEAEIAEYYAQIKNVVATEELAKAKTAQWIIEEAQNRTKKVGLITRTKELLLKAREIVSTTLLTIANWGEANSWWAVTVAELAAQAAAWPLIVILGILLAAVALLVGVIFLLVKAFKAIKNSTPKAQLEAAKEATEQAAEAATQATEAYNGLKESLESIGESRTNLDNLTEGTQEWKDAVQELNNQVLDLINAYPELAAYVKNENGVLTIDYEVKINDKTANDIVNDYGNRATQAQSAEAAARIKQQQAQDTYNYSAIKDKYKAYTTFDDGTQITDRAGTEQIALAIAKGEITKFASKENDTLEKQVQAYAEANGIMIDVTDETVEALREFGQSLMASSAVNEAYYSSMAANAQNAAELNGTDDNNRRAKNYATGDIAEDLVKQNKAELSQLDKAGNKKLANTYAQTILGLTLDEYTVDNNGNITYTDENDEEQTVAIADIKTQMAAANATTELTAKIEHFSDVIGKTSDTFTKHLYDASEGAKLTAKDLETVGADFQAIDLENFDKTKDANGNYIDANAQAIKDYYSNIFSEDDIKELYGGWDAFIQYVAESGQIAANTFANIKDNLTYMKVDANMFDKFELSAGQLSTIGDAISDVFSVSGPAAAQTLATDFENILSNLGDEASQDAFIDLLNGVNWTDIDSITEFTKKLDDLNVDWTKLGTTEDEFKAKIIELGKATKKVDLETLTEQIRNLSSISLKLNTGEIDRSFSENEYNTLIEKGIADATDFVYNLETGNYDYIAGSTDAIVTAIQQQTDDLLNGSDIGAAVDSGKAAKVLKENGILENTDRENKESLYNYLTLYNSQLGGDANNTLFNQDLIDLYSETNNLEALQALQALFDQIISNMINLSVNQQAFDNAERANAQTGYQTNTSAENYAAYQRATDNDMRTGMTLEEHKQQNQLAEDYATALFAQAVAAGVDSAALDEYNQVLETGTAEEKEAAVAKLQALTANVKYNDGLAEITDSYDTWTSLINKDSGLIEASTSEEIKAFNSLRKSVNKMLNTSEDLSDEFWNNAENIKLMKKAAEGDTEAVEALQKAAAKDYLLNIDFQTNTAEAQTAINDFIDYANSINIPQLKAGVEWEGEGAKKFIKSFNEMAAAANLNSSQIQAAVQNMGFNAEITYDQQTRKIPRTVTEEKVEHTGPFTKKITTSSYVDGYDEVTSNFPIVKTLTASGAGGGGISTKTINTGKDNAKKGSSSGSEPNYDNPYESYYNGLKDITEEMRTRENLEKRYQLLVKRGQNNLAKTDDYYKSYVASLEKEYDLQKGIYNAAKSDIESTLKEYSDVTKYATYNWDDNTVEIDWAAIEKLDKNDNEEVGERVDELVDILNDLSDDMKDAEDSMYDLAESFEDMRQELIDSYLDFEDRVANALQKIDQDIIDEKEALYDALDSAASDLVDSVRDNVNATRQLRDNADTEEEIAKKERRLAYLRQDTSGANALEIKQLEEDLADTKQSYQDSLVDQALDTLQAQNDAAAAQRERQIALMESQVEWNEKNGVYTAQVASLLEKAMGDGVLDTKDALYDVLYKGENWDTYSETGLAEALKKANTEALKAYQGLKAADDIEGNSAFDKSSLNNADPEKDVQEPAKQKPAKEPETPAATTLTWDRILSAYNNINGGKWGTGLNNRIKNGKAAGYTEAEVRAGQQLIDYVYPTNLGGKGYTMAKAKQLMGYKTGGLADYTGPAWLDGTKANPELVLNATDTKNFIQLKDILSGILQGGVSGNTIGDYNFDIDINVDEIGNDYDVEQLVSKVKSELVSAMTYRNFNSVSVMR